MALDMTGPGMVARGLSFFSRRGEGRGARARVGGGESPLGNLYLSQLIPALLVVLIGIITIWSASISIPEANFVSHLAGAAIGLVGAFVIWRYDYRTLSNMTTALFVLACVLMVLPRIPGLGYEVNGMMGWVRLGPLRFQPSEPSKIVTIFLMAAACAQYNGKIDTFRDYAKLCGTLLVPLLLILTLDLGTGLVIFFIGATIIICSGAPRSWVLGTIALIVAVAAFVVIESQIEGIPHILKDYQLKRLIVFVDPDVDPTGDGYNLRQAMIAVGSGGLFGKGFGNASQALSGFVPEAQTDFVFSLFAEQFGFVGSVVLLALYAWMTVSTVLLAMRMESMFSKLVLVGCVGMWTFQVLENVGMCLGIMPVTGIPLPFVSYGSSSMVVQLAAVGIVQSVWRHRQKAA
ncbi:FtsW/RodA/SpoVE family cell cycle protein [Thermophilibacter provencensis]|uniref:FtsW/RodA/SpoVE family cell cycle protein n=1 Tax=Thermophilibacter provencensis TaxID=1852386 RepID=A0ABT7V4K1_9ACTN|nr:FtsW/RodA/SpoVE family cell cycle protein [Thermophilibacter provencensis]MDM8270921.1 FtsW/RodA/SpoVE family cell cycle protein [Thermophilibacter provencensis]